MKRFVSLKMFLVLAGGLMTSETVAPVTPPDSRQSDFAQALLAKGPAAQLGDAASVYDWLIGSWDENGRYCDQWSVVPMSAETGDDGCPCFRATVEFDEAQVGKGFRLGVWVDAPLGTVKAQIHHGRRLVRELLRGDG